MKRFLLIAAAVLALFTLVSAGWYISKMHNSHAGRAPAAGHTGNELAHILKVQAAQLRSYARQHGYNTSICFLINMHPNSGSNRFFVYNMQTDSVMNAGLVTHGRCNKKWLNGRQYGNEVGCGCTSLGRYKIGKPYQGRFGLAYKLHGLDSTNSNAYRRYVVLHAHECVPDEEVSPLPICQSDGCPTVSPSFLKKLATMIDASPKPVLLHIEDK